MNEHQEQVAIVKWFRSVYGEDYYNVFFSIPNGGNRDRVTGFILKNEGMLAGVPDLFLAVARGGYHGMFIEMKTPAGKVRTSQTVVQEDLSGQGYKVVICKSYFEAKTTIEEYMGLGKG